VSEYCHNTPEALVQEMHIRIVIVCLFDVLADFPSLANTFSIPVRATKFLFLTNPLQIKWLVRFFTAENKTHIDIFLQFPYCITTL
jgi:hypothetical protein